MHCTALHLQKNNSKKNLKTVIGQNVVFGWTVSGQGVKCGLCVIWGVSGSVMI